MVPPDQGTLPVTSSNSQACALDGLPIREPSLQALPGLGHTLSSDFSGSAAEAGTDVKTCLMKVKAVGQIQLGSTGWAPPGGMTGSPAYGPAYRPGVKAHHSPARLCDSPRQTSGFLGP